MMMMIMTFPNVPHSRMIGSTIRFSVCAARLSSIEDRLAGISVVMLLAFVAIVMRRNSCLKVFCRYTGIVRGIVSIS